MTDQATRAVADGLCPHLDLEGPEPSEMLRALSDPANRCVALDEPLRLSPDQQRLVCATERHLTCRRYQLAATGAPPTSFLPIRPLLLRPAVIVSLLLLVLAGVIAVGYLLGGGTLEVAAQAIP